MIWEFVAGSGCFTLFLGVLIGFLARHWRLSTEHLINTSLQPLAATVHETALILAGVKGSLETHLQEHPKAA